MFPVLSANGPSGYNINNSLRFRRSATASLTRTASFSGTTNTISFWFKRGELGTRQALFGYTNYSNNALYLQFINDTLDFANLTSGSYNATLSTTQVFRDPSTWYHIVFVVDTTNATASNRIRLYINGVQVTAVTATYPAQNTSLQLANSLLWSIGREGTNNSQCSDGYIAEINFIDGQALTPSSFGSTNSTTGVWQPARYTGTYGTNGFYLKFSDIATTSGSNAGLGKDFSGNGNYFNTTNISVTAGVTYDAMIDSPTLTSATVANYCTLNPLFVSTSTISNANLQVVTTVGTGGLVIGTIGNLTTGKYYWEATIVSQTNNPSNTSTVGIIYKTSGRSSDYLDTPDGDKFANPSAATNDILGVAVDFDSGSMAVYKNNTLSTTVSFTSSLGWYPAFSDAHGNQNTTLALNFGQRPFTYTPPTGYVALNTFNLPDSTIKKGNTVMDATLYTQNGTSTNVVTNAGAFKPDLVWLKCRSNAGTYNVLTDTVRGIANSLYSNTNTAENSDGNNFFNSFNSNGFSLTLGDSGTNSTSGRTQVAWQWQAGQGSTVSNTSGSITSTVCANTTAGFSVVTYTGNGTSGSTIGHGLGVAPKFILIKRRQGSNNWAVAGSILDSASTLYLNLTNALDTYTVALIGNIQTSTTFQVGNDGNRNESGGTFVAYCWAEIAGFSKFGSYTGNGSANGPMIYLGFQPKFVMFKDTTSAAPWYMWDASRNTSNSITRILNANNSNAEGVGSSGEYLDFLSNGFKLRSDAPALNNSGDNYIYMAFSSNPFKNSNAF
jgi:hypothetical protein